MAELHHLYQDKADRERKAADREAKRLKGINAKRFMQMPCGHSTAFDGRTCREVSETRNMEKK